jgi:hypothetical protein
MKTVTAFVLAGLVLAAPAAAKPTPGKVSKAKLNPTAAAVAAGVPDVRGRAQLVDGKRRNKVSLHMRHLEPGETYIWHVHQATGEGDPCDPAAGVGNPAPYPGWEYRALVARASGNANSRGRSTTFPVGAPADTGQAYYVNVHLQDGTVIACGVLDRKPRHGRSHRPHGH